MSMTFVKIIIPEGLGFPVLCSSCDTPLPPNSEAWEGISKARYACSAVCQREIAIMAVVPSYEPLSDFAVCEE